MTEQTWDTVIIGGGVAGLSAAQMLGRSRRRVLVIDGGEPRNRFASHMHGVLGQDGRPPGDLLAQGRDELERYDVEIRSGWVAKVQDGAVQHSGNAMTLTTDAGEITARSVLLATGVTDVLPDIPGIAEHWGTSVLHCPYCHGWEVRDQRLGVLVTSPMQAHLASLVRQLSADVTVFAQSPKLLDDETRVRLAAVDVTIIDQPLVELRGDQGTLREAVTADGTSFSIDALFAGATLAPQDDAVAGLGLERENTPFGSIISTQPDTSTSHPRVWAAGNVAEPMANVPMAMSAGSMAGARINAFLVEQDVNAVITARMDWPDVAPAAFWEQRYAAAKKTWSGRVNATVAAVAEQFAPGTALDLGCGEGGDVLWLAAQGWKAHGIDISPTATQRGRDAATEAGLDATFEAADLGQWEAGEEYDLITASFFHSPVDLPRVEVLRRAMQWVAPGGRLVVITHAAAPPWAPAEHVAKHTFLTAQQELDDLAPDLAAWEVEACEHRLREVTAPDGSGGQLEDGVVILRRR